jgi:NAD dependent epimerase/dehydratase family enzyme
MGVAAILGDGSQMISWVHVDDICRAFIHAIEHDNMQGVYNLTAPTPVSNRTLTLSLAQKSNGSLYIPFRVPGFLLKAMLGEMSVEVLKSATVSSQKIQQAGFNFQYPDIDQALSHLSS